MDRVETERLHHHRGPPERPVEQFRWPPYAITTGCPVHGVRSVFEPGRLLENWDKFYFRRHCWIGVICLISYACQYACEVLSLGHLPVHNLDQTHPN